MRLSKIDPNSYSNSEDVVTQHVDLDWTVDFTKQTLKGSAKLNFKILAKSIEHIVSYTFKNFNLYFLILTQYLIYSS